MGSTPSQYCSEPPERTQIFEHFHDLARAFQEENTGNSRSFAQIVGGAGLLLGLLSWLIQCFASSLGRLRLVGAWAPVFNTALLLAGRLVVRGNDAAQGSGYPQMKAMFFGNTLLSDNPLSKHHDVGDFVSLETLGRKASSLALVVGAGIPVGQEGPNVHMAACISHLLRPSFFEKNLTSDLVVQILHAACAIGVACTFSSLLGGVLLSLELMLPQIYTFQVYWGCFLGATCGAVTVMLLQSVVAPHPLISSDLLPLEGVPLHYPLLGCLGYMAMGVLFGVLGGLFNLLHDCTLRICSRFWRRSARWRDLAFVAFVALFIELVNWHLPLLRNRSQPGLLNLLFSKEFFTGHEVHRGDVQLLYLTAAARLFTTLLALCLPLPGGAIGPSLVLGALLTRCCTTMLPEKFFAPFLGTDDQNELDAFEARLAILGASAFGCGVVRAYGIAITVFEVLCLNQMVVPLTLSSLTAIFVADQVSLPFFDLSLKRRGWQGISDMTCTGHGEAPAFQVMRCDFHCLKEVVTLSDVHVALNSGDFSFPVVGRDEWLFKHHPHHWYLRGVISRAALTEVRRRLEELEFKSELRLLELRWPAPDESLLCDLSPLTVEPLLTVQELYIVLKVARRDTVYITGKGVLLGRVGYKELIGDGVPISKGMGAYHDADTFRKIFEPQSPEPWAGL